MKKLFAVLIILFLASCSSRRNAFEDYDISYARSGGASPVYENFFIRGNSASYFYEGQGKKFSKNVKLSSAETQKLLATIEKNKLSSVREDFKKFYDHTATTIKVKDLNIIKTDGSGIMPQDAARWNNVVAAFEELITSKNLRK